MFVLGCIAPATSLDRMGRKRTMIYGCLGLGICMTCAAALLIPGREATSSAAVAFFFIWMLIFGGTGTSSPFSPRRLRALGCKFWVVRPAISITQELALPNNSLPTSPLQPSHPLPTLPPHPHPQHKLTPLIQ